MPPFDTINNITSKIRTVKLFTMQFFLLILYFTLLRSKLSHQNTRASQETLQLVYLLLNVRPCFSPKVEHMGFVVHKAALGQVFLQALWFSLPVIIPPNTPFSSIISCWHRRLIWAHSTRGLSLNLQLQLNWIQYSACLIRTGCSISIFRTKSWYVYNTYLYTIMKQTVTAENPWAFLESKSSEGKMQLFRWLTCDATHQWWHPARIQWVYLHLKVKAITNCSDFTKNMYRNVWKGIH